MSVTLLVTKIVLEAWQPCQQQFLILMAMVGWQISETKDVADKKYTCTSLIKHSLELQVYTCTRITMRDEEILSVEYKMQSEFLRLSFKFGITYKLLANKLYHIIYMHLAIERYFESDR